MFCERVSLSCSPGCHKIHPGIASPLLCVKQRTCLQLWEGLGSGGSKAFYSHGRTTFTNLYSGTLCFLEAFSDAMGRTGRNQGHDADVAIAWGDTCCVTGIRWEQAA